MFNNSMHWITSTAHNYNEAGYAAVPHTIRLVGQHIYMGLDVRRLFCTRGDAKAL